MVKKELMKMRQLQATPHMMRLAMEDKPTKKYPFAHETYNRSLYMRCLVENNILKVSIFLPDSMRMGGKLSAFDLYISQEKKQFITYDRQRDKWLTAMIFNLPFPYYVWQSRNRWISREGGKCIRKYFHSNWNSIDAIYDFQLKIREEELVRRHKRETDPWDEDLKQTPALPKDWEKWVRKVGIAEHYIFYHYTRSKHKTGYCTYCEKEVTIKNPRYNAEGVCPRCRHKITFKSVGKAGTVLTDRHYMYLLQRCKDGMMIRMFEGSCKYRKGNYDKPEYWHREIRRTICDHTGIPLRAYFWGDYKHRYLRWISGYVPRYAWRSYPGTVYGKTIPCLERHELKTTGLPLVIKAMEKVDPEIYLAIYANHQEIEKLVKAGLFRLAEEYCHKIRYASSRELNISTSKTSLAKMLGINSQQLKRLRSMNGGIQVLQWLQYENSTGKDISDQIISWFCKEDIQPKNLQFIWGKMSILSIYNYIRRQMRENCMNSRQTISTWSDYLSMATRLKMNTDDEIVFRTRNLRQRHDELVEVCQEKALEIRAGEILEKYPHIEDIYRALKSKYEFHDDTYAIVVPERIEDILNEGRTLCHCVGDSDRYWDRIERQEAYILFLRKTDELDQPYYTLEIEPNGAIRQKRTYYNRQDKEIDAATPFLLKWQQEISKRLTEEDRALAKESVVLRNQEFEQLREDNVTIHTGALAGQKLVDVLTKDFMEAQPAA